MLPAAGKGQTIKPEVILKHLDDLRNQMHSVQVTWTESSTPGPANDTGAKPGKETITWAMIGNRSCITRQINGLSHKFFNDPQGSHLLVSGQSASGKLKKQVVHFREKVFAPGIMNYGYFIKDGWIVDSIKQQSLSVTASERDPRFGQLVSCSGELIDGAKCDLVLAENENWIAVKTVLTYASGDVLTYSVNSLQMINGMAFPKTVSLNWQKVIGKGEASYSQMVASVEKPRINDVQEGAVTLGEPSLGTLVKDERSGEVYEIGVDGKHIAQGRVTTSGDEAMANGTMRTGWLFLVSVIAIIVCGLSILPRMLHKLSGRQPT